MVELIDIFNILEQIAPVSLSDEFCKKYDMYDNSGIIIDCGEKINGVLFSLDFSPKAVEEAILRKFNVIATHHPAIYTPVKRVDALCDPHARALAECIKNGISVISMHLNFDAAPRGIDYHLMRGLGGEKAEKVLCELTDGCYGRVYDISNPQKFKDFAKRVKEEFSTEKFMVYGNPVREIKRVASFCGAGCDDNAIKFAKKNGADLFVSSDLKHHEIAALLERGVNVINLSHYASENYGFNNIYTEINKKLSVPSAYFVDNELL